MMLSFLFTGAVALYLLLTPPRTVDVELSAESRYLTFSTTVATLLTQRIESPLLTYQGPLEGHGLDEDCEQVIFKSGTEPWWPTLEPIEVPADTVVGMALVNDDACSLEIDTPNHTPFGIKTSAPVGSVISGCSQEILTSATSFELQARAGHLVLSFSCAGQSPLFEQPLTVRSLSFTHLEQPRDDLHRSVSELLDGTVYLEATDIKHELREGQTLDIDSRSGQLELIAVRDHRIRSRFRGIARGLRVRTGSDWHSLAPSRLESLSRERHIALLYTAAAWMFGLIVAFFRWWESSHG